MRFDWISRVDRSEAALRVAGVTLAAGSVAFAAHMIGRSDHMPEIAGIEHLAIYARPTTRHAPFTTSVNIDYTPVGSTRNAGAEAILGDFELIEASPGAATIRTPQGRVARVSSRATLPGAGRILSIQRRDGKWIVVTEKGLICER